MSHASENIFSRVRGLGNVIQKYAFGLDFIFMQTTVTAVKTHETDDALEARTHTHT